MTEEVTSEVVEYNETPQESGYRSISTFGNTVEESKEAFNAINGAEYLHDGMMDTPIEVAHVILERGERRSRESGMSVECINSYIVTPDGKSYFTQSSGIARGLAAIHRLVPDFRDGEGNPIKIAIKNRKLNNGNVLKVVEWL